MTQQIGPLIQLLMKIQDKDEAARALVEVYRKEQGKATPEEALAGLRPSQKEHLSKRVRKSPAK